MTTAQKATKESCLAAARRAFGRTAFVRENRDAITPADRKLRQARAADLQAEHVSLVEQIKQIGEPWPKLLESVEFFLAVNGDEPSGEQLRTAAAFARKLVDMTERRAAIRKERDQLLAGVHRQKWEAGSVDSFPGIGGLTTIQASADTLSELLEKIQAK